MVRCHSRLHLELRWWWLGNLHRFSIGSGQRCTFTSSNNLSISFLWLSICSRIILSSLCVTSADSFVKLDESFACSAASFVRTVLLSICCRDSAIVFSKMAVDFWIACEISTSHFPQVFWKSFCAWSRCWAAAFTLDKVCIAWSAALSHRLIRFGWLLKSFGRFFSTVVNDYFNGATLLLHRLIYLSEIVVNLFLQAIHDRFHVLVELFMDPVNCFSTVFPELLRCLKRLTLQLFASCFDRCLRITSRLLLLFLSSTLQLFLHSVSIEKVLPRRIYAICSTVCIVTPPSPRSSLCSLW